MIASKKTRTQVSKLSNDSKHKTHIYANARLCFAIHLAIFGIVTSFNFIQGLLTGNPLPALAGFLGWGIGIIFHSFTVFAEPKLSADMTERDLDSFSLQSHSTETKD